MTDNTSTLVSEASGVIILTPLLQEALRLGAKIISIEKKGSSPAGDSPPSLEFITLTVNEDKAKIPHWHNVTPDRLSWAVMVVGESQQVETFIDYLAKLDEKRILLNNLADNNLAKVIKPADASRYFTEGRRRIKGKIFKRLGRWFNCPGYLLSLTFDPGKISRADAWKQVGVLRREFLNRLNRWRKRNSYPKTKCISVLEVQPGTGYPHIHLVFPYLRWLAPIAWMTDTWGQAPNSVNMVYRNSLSPVSYVCKYITKLDGWSELALSYLWTNKTRLYSMSRDYTLPDYSDKRVAEWHFAGCFNNRGRLVHVLPALLKQFHTITGTEDLDGIEPEENFEEWVRRSIREMRRGSNS